MTSNVGGAPCSLSSTIAIVCTIERELIQGVVATRRSRIERNTKETQISLALSIDGSGERHLSSPVPFLNHMLDAFARHGVFDLELTAAGDLEIDAHHTVEDIGLCLGNAFEQALGMVRRGGTVSLNGLPPGDFPLDIFGMVLNGITVRGSIVGTRLDLQESLDFAGQGKVKATVSTDKLENINDIFARMHEGKIEGRVVLDIAA